MIEIREGRLIGKDEDIYLRQGFALDYKLSDNTYEFDGLVEVLGDFTRKTTTSGHTKYFCEVIAIVPVLSREFPEALKKPGCDNDFWIRAFLQMDGSIEWGINWSNGCCGAPELLFKDLKELIN